MRQLADYKDYDIDCEPNTAILIAVGSAGDAVPYNNFALHLDRSNIVPIIITQPDLVKYFDKRFDIFTTQSKSSDDTQFICKATLFGKNDLTAMRLFD